MTLPQGYGWDVIYSALIVGVLFLVIWGAAWLLARGFDRSAKKKEETPPVA